MKYLTILLLFIISCTDNPVSSNDEVINVINKGTSTICFWDECYNIEATNELDLCGNAGYNNLTGLIPPEIGNLVNLTYLNLSMNVF